MRLAFWYHPSTCCTDLSHPVRHCLCECAATRTCDEPLHLCPVKLKKQKKKKLPQGDKIWPQRAQHLPGWLLREEIPYYYSYTTNWFFCTMGNTSFTEGRTALNLGSTSIKREKSKILMGNTSIFRGKSTTSLGSSTITSGKTKISLGSASFSRGTKTTSFRKAFMPKRKTL